MPSQAEATTALFNQVEAQFCKAEAETALVTHDIGLAGQRIRLEFAGEALVERILPALSQLVKNAHATDELPDLTIRLWDTVSTGIGAPEVPWAQDQFTSRREIAGANSDRYRVAYDLYCGALSIVSFEKRRAYWWISDRDKLPLYESAAPLRELLQAWSDQLDGMFVHAAALGTDEGACLLVGRGGAGKTTTALACALSGMPMLGEDYCLLTGLKTHEPRVHCLYTSAKLTNQSLALLPDLARHIINPQRDEYSDKAILMLENALAMQSDAAVKAIILPEQTDSGRTQLLSAPATAALMALAPSTILQLSGMDQSSLSRMKQLVERIPAYRLEIGGTPEEAADALRQLMAEAQ